MKASISFYNVPVIRLARDPEFPDLLEIRLGEGRWPDIVKIWSEDNNPVRIVEEDEGRENHADSDILAFAGGRDPDHS